VKLALRAWLSAPGSLSRRLGALGRFEVQTVRECTERLLPGEARDLASRGGRHWVREVVLRVDGVPVVWARSVTPCRALAGPWRALRSLGSRPLAQLLFDDAAVLRSPLRCESHRRGGPWHRRASRTWHGATASPWPRAHVWGRSSVFSREGMKLRVFEAFVPASAIKLGVCRRRLSF
jgi:chorismate--pyruvate lyase